MIDSELHNLLPLDKYGFIPLGVEKVKLADGSIATEGQLAYGSDQLSLKFYMSPIGNNGDANWHKWGELFEEDNYRLLKTEDLGFGFVTPNLYRSLEKDQRLVLTDTFSPRLMHLVYTPEDVLVLQEPLREFTRRMISVDEDRGQINLREGVLRVEHRLSQRKKGGNACSLEIDIDEKSRRAYEAGIFPGHILQKEQDHFCIPSNQFPILPVDLGRVRDGFEVVIENDRPENGGRNMSDERFAELFAGMPLPDKFLIWFRNKQYTPVVGLKGGVHLSSRLYPNTNRKGYQYDRCAQDLAASMESFKRLYDSCQAPQPQKVSK